MSPVERVAELCAELLEQHPHAGLEQVLGRLRGPLLVAVAGRLNSGKSTIVNALIRDRVAPVDNRECTRLVTWYQYGPHERVVVERRDGESREMSLDDGHQIPADLTIDPADIRRVVVTLSNAALDGMTLIDTPGTETTSEDVARGADAVLGLDPASRSAVREADVTIYAMTQLRKTDLDALQQHLAGTSPATCLGLLSKADRIAPEDPWEKACQMASTFSTVLRALVWDVRPVIGLAAESAACGRVTENDALVVRQLVQLDPGELDMALLAEQTFLANLDPADVVARGRLLDRFGMYGLRRLLVDERVEGTANTYSEWLRDLSGFDAVHQVVDTLFRQRADTLKLASAVADLRRLAYVPSLPSQARRTLIDKLDEFARSGELHEIAEIELLQRVRRGEVSPLDPDRVDELERVLGPGVPHERLGVGRDGEQCVAAARAGAKRWRLVANDEREQLPTRRAAEQVERTYTRLAQAVT